MRQIGEDEVHTRTERKAGDPGLLLSEHKMVLAEDAVLQPVNQME
jgi:hypothetical protein